MVSFDDERVTFSYRKSGSNRWRKMSLEPHEFIRRFLQHVLPSGFQKVRHYGILSPNSRISIDAVRWLIALCFGLVYSLRAEARQTVSIPQPIRCVECGGAMYVVSFIPSPTTVHYYDTS